jgi:hypothetical protein
MGLCCAILLSDRSDVCCEFISFSTGEDLSTPMRSEYSNRIGHSRELPEVSGSSVDKTPTRRLASENAAHYDTSVRFHNRLISFEIACAKLNYEYDKSLAPKTHAHIFGRRNAENSIYSTQCNFK